MTVSTLKTTGNAVTNYGVCQDAGLNYLTPYALYCPGNKYGGAAGARTDHSGNGRTLTADGTAALQDYYMSMSGDANGYTMPFAAPALMGSGATVIMFIRPVNAAVGTQFFGTLAASSPWQTIFKKNDGNINVSSAGAAGTKDAQRLIDTATYGQWQALGARWAPASQDQLTRNSVTGVTVITSAAAFTGQNFLNSNNYKLGGSYRTTDDGVGDIAVCAVFNRLLTNTEFDNYVDTMITLQKLNGNVYGQ